MYYESDEYPVRVEVITIQTKGKVRQKKIEFSGIFSFRPPSVERNPGEFLNTSNEDLIKFISGLQKNQKVEICVDHIKICNIKNLSVEGRFLTFNAPVSFQTKVPAKSSKTNVENFIGDWQRKDKDIDLISVLRSIFIVDPRMFQSYNMKSESIQMEILTFASTLIQEKLKNLKFKHKF